MLSPQDGALTNLARSEERFGDFACNIGAALRVHCASCRLEARTQMRGGTG
jgi:hypothetical protein